MSGDLCKSCAGCCRHVVNDETPAEIECPVCHGYDVECQHCDRGYFKVSECPQKFIGNELIADIHVISESDYHLPVAGGILDQSAWWLELSRRLRREKNLIEEEKAKNR